jgi:RTX calcium-binding nonapeptide repeat (4 copies)
VRDSAAAALLCLCLLVLLPTAASARVLDGPPVLDTNGQHDLDPWATKTDSWLNPAVNYSLYQYSHYHSGGSSITASSSNQAEWESVTYTNWSVHTDHYAQTWAYWFAPNPAPDPPTDESPNPLPLASTSSAPPTPAIGEATVDLQAGKATSATARCPAGTRVAHAEGEVLWLTRFTRADAPEPTVVERLTSATARVRAGAVRRSDGRLKILVHCAGFSEVLYVGRRGGNLHHGSDANDRLLVGPVGEIVYAGRGHDHVTAGAGDDVVFGGGGDDELLGAGGQDVLDGGRGADILRGGGGARTLLRGGPGRDMFIGGEGVDYVDARDGASADTVRCGGGRDVVMADRGDKVDSDCERVIRS